MANEDISIEPLLNQSSTGTGSDKKLAFVPIDTAGEADHRTAVSVSDVAQQITPTAGKRTIEIQNAGEKIIYYGGLGLTYANGIKLFPNQTKTFANVKDSFSIYLACFTGETSEARLVEYD